MANKKNIILFEDVLKDLLKWFEHSPGEFIIIGGIAVSLLTRPRTTQDIDVMSIMDEADYGDFLKKANRFGFEARIKNVLEFARENRILLLRHIKSNVNIDISFGLFPFEEESMKRKISHRIGALNVPLPTPEDLIIMKMVAHRPQDLVDINTIIQTYPKLDSKRIRAWGKKFADALDNPDIMSDLENVFIAQDRFNNPKTKFISGKKLRRKINK